ncbi:PLP-dependent aminotransferase family protein [Janthinobacterium sp. GW458P]|uniref:MocR-like pyridoxine biosynthesis transcription factor PdxR n=1 Tax=Janthinobacterium sp. GW458P TaxID=1981504 RepID=UPI000A325A04|nr:PLP-dependent aminotransferase family protein [Janthinobacterium sp. GW458P]MBE3028433.1 PLP-dependent aminotransferase family protein [Janthinobacterium sp. GW458P]
MDFALLLNAFEGRHRERGWSRQRLLHECLRTAIRDGQLAPGTRLAATRVLAAELGLARNTVLYAYEQLASEGFVLPDRRGTVVAGSVGAAMAPLAEGDEDGLSFRARHLRGVAGQDVNAAVVFPADAMAAFAPGVPALDEFPLAQWRRVLDRAWRALTPRQLNYGDPAGEPQLRMAIADHLRSSRGVVCNAGQVFITDGTQSSLDVCLRAFADPGETLWMEHPGYGGALAAGRAAGLHVVGIPVDMDGIAPTDRDWQDTPPRLIYTTPSHQYPTGSVLSPARRMALLERARAAGALIIEDDYDSEFRHGGPPLAAMQGLVADAPVVYLGTFSKTMFPALRIAFIVVPAALAAAFAQMQAQGAARGRVAEQLALAEFLRSGLFARHVRRMRRLYRQRRDALSAALQRHACAGASIHGGSAGMHLALRFHDAGWDDLALSRRAAHDGIVALALSAHGTGERAGWSGFLLGYAQVPAEHMDGLARRVGTLLAQAGAAGQTKRAK